MNMLLLNKFGIFLHDYNYSEKTIKLYLNAIHEFEPSLPIQVALLYKEILDYKNINKPKISKALFNNLRASAHLFFLMEAGISIKEYRNSITTIDDCFVEKILDKYYRYATEFKKITAKVASAETNHIRWFLNFCKINSRDELSKISVFNIQNYIKNGMYNLKASSKGRYITSIRNFMRFLEEEHIKIDQSALNIPLTIASWNNTVPVILSEEEEIRLRDFYNMNTKRDTRNKLIILLQLDLGLRSAEVANLKIDNIHWITGTILIENTKNKQNREIPISVEIGNLLERYILNYRGKTSNQYLILTLNSQKKDSKINTEDVRRVVRFAFKKIGIIGYWKGTHTLRRTAASKLYKSQAGLKITADILGHISLDSTSCYVKVDLETMKSITTPWPGGGKNA